MTKYLQPDQIHRLQGLIKMKGEHSGTLAVKLGIPQATLISTINGWRRHAGARQALAQFLGEPLEQLFGGDGAAAGAPDSGAPGGGMQKMCPRPQESG